MKQGIKTKELITLLTCLLVFSVYPLGAVAGTTTANDGDWSAKYVTLTNTPEAAMMVRTGDIDNLGFGWPAGYDPFSGNYTPVHSFPWTVDPNDPDGTDRIMVVSSYNGNPPCGQDGYTSSTSRPDNNVRPIVLTYSLNGITVNSAILQIFVDDFQAPVWCSQYKVTINGVRITEMEIVINALNESGPIGQLITVKIPNDKLYLISNGNISIKFDDDTTGAGDGYAIDFVKLLINPSAVTSTGTISGTVNDAANGANVSGANVSAGGVVDTTTDSNGVYNLTGVPAGLVPVTVSASGYIPDTKTVNVVKDTTATLNFTLSKGYSLTVAKSGTGSGTVLSSPSGLDCGSMCSYQFIPGTTVTLTAVADSGSTFNGWTGCDSTNGAQCTLAMSAARNVTATFTQITYTVTPSAGTHGTISPSTPQTVNSGATTQFTVTPDTGYAASVGGTCGGTLSGTTYTTLPITGNCSVVATFATNHHPVQDFNSDGKSDILLQNLTTGAVAQWLMNGAAIKGGGYVVTSLDPGWQVAGTGDFNGDGYADILLQNSSGAVVVWLMNGSSITGGDYVTTSLDSTWKIVGVGDFDGDGKSDILLQNKSGAVVVWLMNGSTINGSGYVSTALDPSWQINGVGDFNGDGKSDILLQNSSGAVVVWLMNGSLVIGGGYVSASSIAPWQIKGVGDFDGDGKSDLLLQNSTTGAIVVWLLNGAAIKGGGYVTTSLDSSWLIKGVGDFDGDGKSDILLYNSSGAVSVWLLNGAAIKSGGYVTTSLDPGWLIK